MTSSSDSSLSLLQSQVNFYRNRRSFAARNCLAYSAGGMVEMGRGAKSTWKKKCRGSESEIQGFLAFRVPRCVVMCRQERALITCAIRLSASTHFRNLNAKKYILGCFVDSVLNTLTDTCPFVNRQYTSTTTLIDFHHLSLTLKIQALNWIVTLITWATFLPPLQPWRKSMMPM